MAVLLGYTGIVLNNVLISLKKEKERKQQMIQKTRNH